MILASTEKLAGLPVLTPLAPFRSSVRLLESSTGALTTELLGLGSSGVSDDQGLVVLKEHFLELSL